MKRYSPVAGTIDNSHTYITVMKEYKDGEWVRWEDVKEIVEEYQKMINEGREDINYL